MKDEEMTERHVSSDFFTENYYLSQCAGYGEFFETRGHVIDKRLERALSMGGLRPGMKVLDIGCGRGEIILHSAKKGASAIGVDYSLGSINICYNFIKEQDNGLRGKVLFLVGDAMHLPFKESSFDRVFFLDIIEHLYPKEIKRTFLEIKRVLKPNGIVIIHTAPNLWVHRYTYPIYRLLAKAFKNKRLPKKLDLWGGRPRTHINKQSILSLKKILNESSFESRVWLEDPKPYSAILSPDNEEKNTLKRNVVWLLRNVFPFKLFVCNHIFAVGKKKPPKRG